MPMWEYEYFIRHINDLVKEENQRNEQEQEKYKINDYKRMANPNNMRRSMPSGLSSKIPSMPGMSMPKF